MARQIAVRRNHPMGPLYRIRLWGMRGTYLGIALFVAACGGDDNPASDGPPGGDDAPPQIDSNPDIPDAPMANCVPQSGSTIDVETLPGLNGALDDAPMLVTAPTNDRRLFIVN